MIYENRTTDLISWEGLWIVRRFDHTCYSWDQAGTTRGQSPAQMSIRCTSVYFVFCKTNKHCCSRNLIVFLYNRTDFSRHRFQVSSLLIMKDSDYDMVQNVPKVNQCYFQLKSLPVKIWSLSYLRGFYTTEIKATAQFGLLVSENVAHVHKYWLRTHSSVFFFFYQVFSIYSEDIRNTSDPLVNLQTGKYNVTLKNGLKALDWSGGSSEIQGQPISSVRFLSKEL